MNHRGALRNSQLTASDMTFAIADEHPEYFFSLFLTWFCLCKYLIGKAEGNVSDDLLHIFR